MPIPTIDDTICQDCDDVTDDADFDDHHHQPHNYDDYEMMKILIKSL